MKKSAGFAIAIVIACFTRLLVLPGVSAKSLPTGEGGGKPIPDAVLKIAMRSCDRCHTGQANTEALSHLNLSEWNKNPPGKQSEQAQAICNMLSKDKMPPKKFREDHPGDLPSPEEVRMICNWAKSTELPPK